MLKVKFNYMLSTKPHKIVWKNERKHTGFRKAKQDRDEEGRSAVHIGKRTLMTLTSLPPCVINDRNFFRKRTQSEK